jgi:release factor glutamine methyltransferase
MVSSSQQTIADCLQHARQRLVNSDSAQLDAELLLSHTLQVSRSYLHAWSDRTVASEQANIFFSYLDRRAAGEPIAYLLGTKEFWSLTFKVTGATLIPRPETELIVEHVLAQLDANSEMVIADLGTGSGAIALALAHERPRWLVYATDLSEAALEVARFNAANLAINNVIFSQGDWLSALPRRGFDAIISNPPYIATGDRELDADVLQFEPTSALIAEDNGLADLHHIIQTAKELMNDGGMLWLEHGHKQAAQVAKLLEISGYSDIILYQDLSGLDRVSQGRYTTG